MDEEIRSVRPSPAGDDPPPHQQIAEDAADTHGRRADSPRRIPRRGWRDILLRVWNNIGNHNIAIIAAGVAFFSFLAVPAALSALVTLYGLAFDPQEVGRQVAALRGLLPTEALTLVSDQLTTLTSHPRSELSVSFAVALVVALWSVRSAVSTLISAINVAYQEREKRSILKFEALALMMTLGGIGFASLTLGLLALVPVLIEMLPLGPAGKLAAAFARWPILLIVVMASLDVLYRIAPSRRRAKWRWISWGAALATLLWLAASALFSLYVQVFASYDKTYGSLGAVAVLMMWLWVTSIAILLGAELDAEIEHQTARDSTIGPEKPMGQRQAVVADTIGETR